MIACTNNAPINCKTMLSLTRIVLFPKARPYFLLAQRNITQVAVPFQTLRMWCYMPSFCEEALMHDSNRKY